MTDIPDKAVCPDPMLQQRLAWIVSRLAGLAALATTLDTEIVGIQVELNILLDGLESTR